MLPEGCSNKEAQLGSHLSTDANSLSEKPRYLGPLAISRLNTGPTDSLIEYVRIVACNFHCKTVAIDISDLVARFNDFERI
jgi:hypothetical protein